MISNVKMILYCRPTRDLICRVLKCRRTSFHGCHSFFLSEIHLQKEDLGSRSHATGLLDERIHACCTAYHHLDCQLLFANCIHRLPEVERNQLELHRFWILLYLFPCSQLSASQAKTEIPL